jgi:uncharacterized protein (UPF0332 family)
MPEVEFARETLRFVQMFLHMGVTNIWLYRMLLGRLYYAAHHLGRRLCIEAGLDADGWRENVHRRVLDELHQHYVETGQMPIEVWRGLLRLRNWRLRADYELARPMRLRFVNQAVTLFTRFADECYQILGVDE